MRSVDLAAILGFPLDSETLDQSAAIDTMIEFSFNHESHVVIDPSASNALSFLQLVYRPTVPFNTIITNNAIAKLQDVFSWLLRLLQAQESLDRIPHSRVWQQLGGRSRRSNDAGQSMAQSRMGNMAQLSRSDCAMAIKLLQATKMFVKGLSWYAFDLVVKAHWNEFDAAMDLVAERAHAATDLHPASQASQPQQSSLPSLLDCAPDSDTAITEKVNRIRTLAASVTNHQSLHQALHTTIQRIHSHLMLAPEHKHLKTMLDALVGIVVRFSRFLLGFTTTESLPALTAAFQVRYQLLVAALIDQQAGDAFAGAGTVGGEGPPVSIKDLLFALDPALVV
eukprot:jgi/Hompol1/4463/HPOL_003641-RA